MSPNYTVSEKDRVNAEKKRQQMVLLESSIYSLRVDFNKKLDFLKNWKVRIINNVKEKNERIKTINSELGIEETLI